MNLKSDEINWSDYWYGWRRVSKRVACDIESIEPGGTGDEHDFKALEQEKTVRDEALVASKAEDAQTQNALPRFDVIRLLRVIAEHECDNQIFWHCDLSFFVNCNDVFCWGCADAEDISSDSDIDDFERALKDAGCDGAMLYVARRRKMRPQGAMYKHLEVENRHWFDECGPERETWPGNPEHQNSVGRATDAGAPPVSQNPAPSPTPPATQAGKTPRTNAEVITFERGEIFNGPTLEVVLASFARKLERELSPPATQVDEETLFGGKRSVRTDRDSHTEGA